MAVFASTEDLVLVMTKLWERIRLDPDMSSKLISSKLIVQFNYRDPEGLITIDCSNGEELKVIAGATEIKPIIEMSMKSDTAHEFWMGRVSVPVAILTGQIVSKGPTPKALALLPIIKPAYSIYPQVLQEAGKKALISG